MRKNETINAAIDAAERAAVRLEERATCLKYANLNNNFVLKRAADQRQIADWLKELLRLRNERDLLLKQIKDLKKTVESNNSDYLTGYICALSAVEGMIS